MTSSQTSSRLGGERAGDRDPLALAAGELDGIAAGGVATAQPAPALGDLAPIVAREEPPSGGTDAAALERLTDRPARVERRVRALEDVLDPLAGLGGARARRRGRACPAELISPVTDVQAGDAARERRLARAGLADERHALLPADIEVDLVQHLVRAVAGIDVRSARTTSPAGPIGARSLGHPDRRRRVVGAVAADQCLPPAYEVGGWPRHGVDAVRSGARTSSRRGGRRGAGAAGDPEDCALPRGPAPPQAGACTGGAGPRRRPAAPLDDAARVHDRDPVGEPRDDRQIVADVERRDAVLLAEPRTSFSTRAWVITSSPVVGSSQTITCGRQANASAIATRCCWPPES